MSSKRRLRRKACEGKNKHTSQDAAMNEIRHMGDRASVGAYKCKHCRHWHVGHNRGSRYLIRSHLAVAILYHD